MNNDMSVRSAAGSAETGVKKEDAQSMIKNFMGHSYAMLTALRDQYYNTKILPGHIGKGIDDIYNKFKKELDTKQKELNTAMGITNKGGLAEEHVIHAKKLMKSAQKEIGAIYAKFQAEVAKHLGQWKLQESDTYRNLRLNEKQEIESQLKNLSKAKEGRMNKMEAGWIKFKAWTGLSKTSTIAVDFFNQAIKQMQLDSRREITLSKDASQVEKDKAALQSARFQHSDKPLTSTQKKQLTEEGRTQRKLQKEELNRRVGVVGAEGIYRIRVCFDPKTSAKQFKSFMAQRQSGEERQVIQRDVPIAGSNKKVTSKLTPLNTHFDESLKEQNNKLETNEFGSIFGKKGISSFERQGQHLVNGYDSRLVSEEGEELYSALRHGACGAGKDVAKFSKPMREQIARKSAEELVKAALLKQIADSGKSFDDYMKDNSPVKLQINSLSLLTPVNPINATVMSKVATPERELVEDQAKALDYVANSKEPIIINGKPIHIDLQVNKFNFGVNEYAVGSLAVGSRYQHDMNVKAMGDKDPNKTTPNSFQGQFSQALKLQEQLSQEYQKLPPNYYNDKKTQKKALDEEIVALKAELKPLEEEIAAAKGGSIKPTTTDNTIKLVEKLRRKEEASAELQKKIVEYEKKFLGVNLDPAEMNQLMFDIQTMMSTDTSYLETGNQYELAARIISLNHQMGLIYKAAGKPAPQMAFNCMSDKDRSGMMDCVGKSFAAMRKANGKFPTREELDYKGLQKVKEKFIEKNAELTLLQTLKKPIPDELRREIKSLENEINQKTKIQTQFANILYDMLLKAGSIDLIETNTGVKGYKLHNEANLAIFKHLRDEFSFLQIQGLGETTES